MKRMLQSFTLALFTVLCTGQESPKVNPCLETEHQVTNDLTRSTGYDLRSTDTPLCDDRLKMNWYKFVDLKGNPLQMPSTCPGINTCGTRTAYWLHGKHPGKTEGIQQLRLCGKTSDDPKASCCDTEIKMFVKNCGDFYVYNMYPMMSDDCPSRYCVGTIKRCSADQWSDTGFEPCQDRYPALTTPPEMLGPIVKQDQPFEFRCRIIYNKNEPHQRFDVTWTFNGKEDPIIGTQTLAGATKVAILSADKVQMHTDEEITCQVKTYFIGREHDKSPLYTSNPTFFGIKERPVLTGPTLRTKTSFEFQCQVIFTAKDARQQVEVVWLLDGQPVPAIKSEIFTGSGKTIILVGTALADQINKHVSCQARLIYAGGVNTASVTSNAIFFGITITPATINLQGSDIEKELTVTSTIPVVCNEGQNCCVAFKLNVNMKAVVYFKDSCEHKICSKDWDTNNRNAVVKVKLVPFRNAISAGTREAILSIQTILYGTGPYIAIFKNYKPNPIKVLLVLNAGFKCEITGDPHVIGFDYRHSYHWYKLGEYIAYEVKERDFVVQVKTWNCWHVSCVCGVVVKENNNIISVIGCHFPNRLSASIVSIHYTDGATVERSHNALHIGITLPSGSDIRIDLHDMYMNVYIKSPAYDKFKARGICGTNDGDQNNDFTHRNGLITNVCPHPGACVPDQFTESWRVTGQESLFLTIPQKTVVPTTQFCTCEVLPAGKSTAQCSPSQHSKDKSTVCNGCTDITDRVTIIEGPLPVSSDKQWSDEEDAGDYEEDAGGKRFAKRSSDQGFSNDEAMLRDESVSNEDSIKSWPNDNGVTETEATAMCNKSIATSQLFSRCQSVGNLFDNAISNCLGDILYGGTTEAMEAVISSFTTGCQQTLAEDEKNYSPNEDGDFILDAVIVQQVCPIECLRHGVCGDGGKCVCHSGWEGETCHLEKGKGPEIIRNTKGPLCYAEEKACDSVDLLVFNVDIFDALQCRVQITDGTGTQNDKLIKAIHEGSPLATCSLPQTGLSSQNFTVSVTKDETLYSNELLVHTFDSTCLDCTDSGCVEKKTACHINKVCYANGQVNKNDAKLICDVSKNTTSWSASNSGIATNNHLSWTKVLASVTATLVVVASSLAVSSLTSL